jgi:hypothetical protein
MPLRGPYLFSPRPRQSPSFKARHWQSASARGISRSIRASIGSLHNLYVRTPKGGNPKNLTALFGRNRTLVGVQRW